MNHVRWAFAILIVIVSASLFSEYMVKRQCNELTEVLYELKDAAENGDNESAEKLCDTVNDKWNKVETMITYTVPMDRISQAEQSICRLKPLFMSGSDEFEAEVMTAAVICSRICG